MDSNQVAHPHLPSNPFLIWKNAVYLRASSCEDWGEGNRILDAIAKVDIKEQRVWPAQGLRYDALANRNGKRYIPYADGLSVQMERNMTNLGV